MEYLEKRSGNCKCPGVNPSPGHFFYNRQEPLCGSFFCTNMKGWPQFWFGMQSWNQTEAEIK